MGSAAYHVAAAMALSMSAVAFAKNYDSDGTVTGTGSEVSAPGAATLRQKFNFKETYIVDPNYKIDDNPADGIINEAALNNLIADGKVKVDVSILSNKRALADTPKVTTGKDGDNNPAAVLIVKFQDTWGTGEETAELRIRITAKEDLKKRFATGNTDASDLSQDVVFLKKGDTITMPVFKVTAYYGDIAEYGETITMTLGEVEKRDVKASGETMYDKSGDNEKVVIYFKDKRDRDVAAFETKVSPNQKDVNLGYETSAIDEVTEQYPDVDFEFINFYATKSGKNHFTNSGTLYFNPIGGADTTVYEVTDEGLVNLNAKYDSDDKVVYVSNVRDLTQYVVASEELPEEEPEEESSSSEAPAEVPETPANPSTGAL